MNAKININPLALRAVMPCAVSREVRFYLNTVALFQGKAGGVLAVATNGAVMGFAFDPSGTWEGDDAGPVLIRRTNDRNSATTWKNSILAAVAALKPGRKDTPKACTITTAGSMASLSLAGVERSHPSAIEVGVRYPDLTPYAAPRYSGELAAYDPELLARVFEGPQACGNHKGAHAVLLHNGPKAGTVVGMYDETTGTCLRFMAVVMPLRIPQGREAHPAVQPQGLEYVERAVPGVEWLAAAFAKQEA